MTEKTRQSLGGTARAAKMTPQRRTEIAKAAAKSRWDKLHPEPKQCAYIYAIGPIDGPHKIGYAFNPLKRIKSFQCGNHMEWFVVFQHKVERPIATLVEGIAHRILRKHRLRGEWFDASAEECRAAIEEAHGIAIAPKEPGKPKIPRALGRSPLFNLRIHPEMMARIKADAEERGISIAQLMLAPWSTGQGPWRSGTASPAPRPPKAGRGAKAKSET